MSNCSKIKMPLTDSQFGIYLECINDDIPSSYLIPLSFSFPKNEIDREKLAESFNMVAENFSAFSIVISQENAEPFMTTFDGELPKIKCIKASDNEVDKIKSDLFVPFSFDGGLLWRGVIIETETRIVLALVFHHTIFDGTSIRVLNNALSMAYEGKLVEETNTVFDAKNKEIEENAGEISKISKAYFESYMDGIDSDSNINPDKGNESKKVAFSKLINETNISEDELCRFAKDNGVTENIVFLSAFSYAIAKFNNLNDVIFSSVESGRFGGGYENSIGMFVKSFPLRFTIDENIKSDDFVKNIKKNYINTLKNNHMPYSELVKEYPGCNEINFIYQGELLKELPINGYTPKINLIDTYQAVSNLDLLIFKENGNYCLWAGFKESSYSKDLIECFVDFYLHIVNEVISGKKLCDFDLCSEKSREFIVSVNKNESNIDTRETIIELFDKAVKEHGENIAVSYNNKKITYNELSVLTKKIASYITNKGLGKDDFVSVLIPRNEFMSIASLGIVRARAAYQPLDPTYPVERLNFMVKDSKTRLLIADRSLVHLLNEYNGDVLYTDEIESLPEAPDYSIQAKPDDAFILIYTSGTTGLPKGCILENKNMVGLNDNHKKKVALTDKSRVATVASFGFDAAMMDIFTAAATGASLYIVPEEIKLDMPQVEKFYCENGITNGFMTTQLGRMFLEQTKCETLKYFMLGGEKLVPFTPPESVACLNCYGPSETAAYVCGYKIRNNSSFQPIGKINYNIKFYVVDKNNRLLPTSACGELCVAGIQVGRGYFERPEKTAESFVKNPFCKDEGYDRMYKTGDIVRFLPDGNVDYIGRRDGQVKIRGFRIELTEVEQVIRSFEGIKNATVQAYDDPVSGKFLAAFVVSDKEVNVEELNSFIASQKPPYMVPAVTMQIDNIPVNANSKVDKRKLPKPERKTGDIVKPQNETQGRIFALVSQVLGTEEFGIENDFYMLGLSSIGSIKLCSLLADEFNVSIQMKDLKNSSTISKLEKYISSMNQVEETTEILDDYPLSKTQEGIYVECISRPDSTCYNIPLLLKLSEEIDVNKLKKSIAVAVNAHSFLKTVLVTDDSGSIRQKRMDGSPFTAEDIEVLKGISIDEFKNNAVTPFDINGSRLFRIKIICDKSNYFYAEFHHIIVDGTSINIILKDIEKAYNGDNIENEKFTGFEVALKEYEQRKTDALKESKDYYSKLLNDLDMNFLPEADRLLNVSKSNGKFECICDAVDVNMAKKYCENNGVGLNGLLCSAFGFTLAKYACTDYSVFNTIYNGRNDSRAAETVGMLVKTLPVVCKIDKEKPIEIVKEISNQLVDNMANDIYSFAEISRDLGVKNDIIFIYQGDDFEFTSFCGKPSELEEVNLSESKTPVSMEVMISGGKFKCVVEYDPERYTEKLIRTFSRAFCNVLNSFINDEESKNVSLLDNTLKNELDKYNNTELEYDTSKTVIDFFLENVKKYPDKELVVFKDRRYTYKQVFEYSSRIANYLKSRNIGNGNVVSILINRDEYMTIAGLGVLMSGAAFVGLDPTYPKERLEFMVKDSGSSLIISEREITGLVEDAGLDIVYVDEIENMPAPDEYVNTITPDDNILIIYSSGTTGLPKGSVLSHGNIACFFVNYSKHFEIDEKSNIATYASFGFDGGPMDIFASAMAGATLFVIPDEIRLDIVALENFYTVNKITNGFMTTQVGTMFISNTKCKSLKNFVVGGEAYIPVVSPDWVRFFNGYGPSETFCYVNTYETCDLGKIQPIGKVNYNVKEYIIDKFGNRLPFGACGELCISGGQTGKGYLNREEKTKEVFVKNPFCNVKPYDRMYRTGDIVRQMPDGNYVFVGRRDGQVKIRGFRIELTEVEQVIRSFDGIENVSVQAYDSNSGGKYIAAFIVSDKKIDISSLNAFIKESKPDYMVPAVTIQIDDIPLTSNGKVDKKKLPAPTESPKKEGLEPTNETEEQLCEIFGEVLGLDKVFADDDFFNIGGSSISAIQVVVKCNKIGYDIVFKNLFANPTPHLLAEFVHNGKSKESYVLSDEETAKFDYSALECNTVEYVDEIKYSDIGDVLLTGVTGFLGSHILRELLDNTMSNVICPVRGKDDMSAQDRFQMMMTYYFEDWYTADLAKRVTIIEGELGDTKVLDEAKKLHFDTIINSAANVKHFAAGEELLKDNFNVVQNLINFAEETKAKLVQISSTSVSGEAINSKIPEDYMFKENELSIGQSLENKYIYSKYQAEQAVIDAISKGRIKGKIIRLGNLQARIDDSEFQLNASTNGFLKQFVGYFKLGMFPVDIMDRQIEFSPIDSVAKACILLSGTPDKFTVFHAKNCNKVNQGYFVEAMRAQGLNISIVDFETFSKKYQTVLDQEEDLSDYSSLIAYLNNKTSGGKNTTAHQIESDATFTTKSLYKLGFSWPLISMDYLRKMVETLVELGFFEI